MHQFVPEALTRRAVRTLQRRARSMVLGIVLGFGLVLALCLLGLG